MKNVLIYYWRDKLSPTGGPKGYLYNLYQGLQKIQNNNLKISFLDDIKANATNEVKFLREKYNKLPLFIKRIYRIYGRYLEYRSYKAGIPTINLDEIRSFDAIHFHDVFAVFKNRKVLDSYEGSIILTTHCPKPPHLEKIEDMYSNLERFLFKQRHSKFYENCVKYAFERADYIMFPCKEAEEPYYNHWEYYRAIHEKYDSKFIYFLTGIQDCLPKVKLSKNAIRAKYNIPKDAFVISFAGRHNAVKGYDILKEIGKTIKSNNVYFLIAGEEAPLRRPNVNHWIEVGWTNDPYSIINASDMFILPNKETYFDLVLLEVLSLGVAVLASRTGGNKYFSAFDSGIHFYDTKDQAVEFIESICKMTTEVNSMGVKNRQLFESFFTDKIFAQNYVSLLERL